MPGRSGARRSTDGPAVRPAAPALPGKGGSGGGRIVRPSATLGPLRSPRLHKGRGGAVGAVRGVHFRAVRRVHFRRGHDRQAAGRQVDVRDAGAGERHQQGRGAVPRDFQAGTGAVVVHLGHTAQVVAGGVPHGQADEVGEVEFVVLRLRQLRAVDVEPGVGQLLRRGAVGDLHRRVAGQFGELRQAFAAPAQDKAPALRVGQRTVRGQVGGIGGVAGHTHQAAHAVRPADHAQQDAALRHSPLRRWRQRPWRVLRLLLRRGLHRLLPVHRHRAEAGLAQEAGDAVGRQGALADPVADARRTGDALLMFGRQHGVVAAQLLDEPAVPRAAAVGNHDVVVRALLGAGAGQADFQAHSGCLLV